MNLRLIAVSGWATPPDALRPLAERLGDATPDLVDWPSLLGTSTPLFNAWMGRFECCAPRGNATVLLGWSLGGLLALRALANAKDDVRPDAVVLVGSFARFVEDVESGWPGADSRLLKAMSLKISRRRENVLNDFAQACWTGCDLDASVMGPDVFVEQAARFSTPELKSGLETLASLDLREELASIDLPTLVLHGESDAIVPHEAGQRLAEALPRAEFRKIAGGHAIPISHPERLADPIREFFASTFSNL